MAEALARNVQRRALEDGAEVLALHTAEFMHGARALYDRLGFQRAPELDADLADYLGSNDGRAVPALAYIRPLTAAPAARATDLDDRFSDDLHAEIAS